jgi:hypothetical protein
MKPDSRTNRIAFRRAVWASVMLHVLVAGTLVLILRAGEKRSYAESGIDTRADEPQVRISLMEDVTVSIEEPPSAVPAKPQGAIPETPQAAATPEPPALLPSKPFAQTVPQTLPPELVAILRKPTATPSGTLNPPASDPNTRPAGGVAGTNAGTPAGGVPAIHGALAPGKTVVYALDASGSMGAAGKFDAARAALISTLRQQPATVRFQIIVYAGTATPLLTSDGHGLLASEANVRLAAEKLATLEARGRSNHLAAIRAALAFQPDVILMLTDADDLSAAATKPVLASSPKPVLVCVGQVATEGVQRPRELK